MDMFLENYFIYNTYNVKETWLVYQLFLDKKCMDLCGLVLQIYKSTILYMF